MALDLEEQEKLEELKAWWKRYGGLVTLTVAAAAIAIAGSQYWRSYQSGQALLASRLYETVSKAAQSGDAKTLREAGGALAEGYPRSLYASLGALVSARFYFDRNDAKNAKAQLQWVLDRSPSDDVRDLARLRLAAVLLDEKSHEEALKLLETRHAPAYLAQYAALKGDVLAAMKRTAEAKDAYRIALEKIDPADAAFRDSVRMRLDALGG